MIELKLGIMRKVSYSTKQTMTDVRTEQVCIKENCDLNSPIFKLNFNPSKYNYCSWVIQEQNIERFYYIDNIVYVHNNLFEIHCSLDILATYRNVILYGIRGRCLYCTNDYFWDQYYDDMRFSPSNLDTYRHSSFVDDRSYLYSHNNVFGLDNVTGNPILWDCQYDDSGNITSYGDGCYFMQTNGPIGVYNYIFDKATFERVITALLGGISAAFYDEKKYINICNWMPINYNEFISKIPGATTPDKIHFGGIDFVEVNAEYKVKQIPTYVLLTFDGGLKIPREDIAHPLFMENSRWNNLQLKTPSGVSEVNLDMCYPASKSNRGLYFSTTFDVISGDISTKYTYDTVSNFNDLQGSIIYESNFNCTQDILGLIQRSTNVKDIGIAAGVTAAAIVGAGLTGGLSSAGLAKVKAGADMIDRGTGAVRTLKSGESASLGFTTMINGIEENMKENAGTIGKIAVGGTIISKALTNTNRSTSSFTSSASLANIFNTVQLGSISLRLKPFRCRDFETDIGETYLDVYKKYCNKHGYPVNMYFDSIGNAQGHLYVFENPQIHFTSSYSYTYGLTDEIQSAILQIVSSGILVE